MVSERTKVAWVTGGGSGIGLGIAKALAEVGYTVFISGRTASKLTEAIAGISAQDADTAARLCAIAADVRSSHDLEAAASRIAEKHGHLDVLVAAAGTNVTHRSLEETTEDDWRTIVDTNAMGAFLSIKSALPLLRRSEGAIIISVSSISGLRSLAGGGAAYCASKFAQSSLGIFSANELASEGIRVTNIYPGDVDTPIIDLRPAPPPADVRATMVKPEDIGALAKLIVGLPPTAHISEVTIKPAWQTLV